ncbi:IS3 family transposase [Corynebacterium propinquum]|uniref:IS3 family transposase n=1 Tax=Corynebacterium propinquum TaxID=43769 RepID=UPI003CCFF3E3
MRARRSLSESQREQLVDLFEQGLGYRAAAHRLGVGLYPVKRFERRFKLHGRLCLVDKPTKQHFSFEIKKEVVDRFIGGESKMELARKFGLSSDQLVSYWVRAWHAGGDQALQPKPKGRAKGSASSKPLTEEDRLRREVEKLRAENAYFKKIAGLEEPATRLKVEAIVTLKSAHRLEDLLVAACLARSTFFYHQQRLTMADKHAQLKQAIVDVFERMNRRYGYRRVHAQLRREGWVINHKLVYKLMGQLGLKSKVRAKKKHNSYKGTVSYIASNVVNRCFTPDEPNTVWASDVTEFRVAGTKVYLSPIMDLCDRSIVSYSVSTSPNTAFTSQSLRDAIAQESPDQGLVVHTDQGFQYQHSSWRTLIAGIGGTQSMSRKGNCYDNAVMENFFGHLKSEMYHGESFTSVEEFYHAIDEYIRWYNHERIQKRLKGLTPVQYRNQTLKPLTA